MHKLLKTINISVQTCLMNIIFLVISFNRTQGNDSYLQMSYPCWHVVCFCCSMVVIEHNNSEHHRRGNHHHDTIEVCAFIYGGVIWRKKHIQTHRYRSDVVWMKVVWKNIEVLKVESCYFWSKAKTVFRSWSSAQF